MRLSPIPATTRTQSAQHIAGILLRHAEGLPVADPATWEAVCQKIGAEVRYFDVPGAGAGEWCADIPDGDPAVVAINRANSPKKQARAFVHELAELLLFRMQPPLLPDMSDAGRYDGDPASEQHKIARRVEGIVLGASS